MTPSVYSEQISEEQSDLAPSVKIFHMRDIRPDPLVCQFCGSSLRALVEAGASDSTSKSDVSTKYEVSKTPRKYKEKPRPGIVKDEAVRRLVRTEMIARIPGFNRPKARAVVAAYPTLGAIRKTPFEVLAMEFGQPLAEALKLVIQ